MSLIRKRLPMAAVVGVAAATALSVTGIVGASAASATSAATGPRAIGHYSAARMSVEVSLAPRDRAGLASELRATYRKGSASYHHWLARGTFDRRFAPTASTRAAVVRYLTSEGLRPVASSSPFLVRAVGSSSAVAAAFHTSLDVYRGNHDVTYFRNATAVRLPASLSKLAYGVIGLTNTIRSHTNLQRTSMDRPLGHASSNTNAACETPYPTAAQLGAAVVNGTPFPYGYGNGPSCSGLTPSQTNGLYGAPKGGAGVQGRGVTAAVFELSAYQGSDISTWSNQFYGAGYTPPLQNVIVDGGPLAPICPAGDECPAPYNGYSGDIEVDADIEMELTVAPDLKTLQVYEAPNDYTGQTELDLYTAIADQDTAATVSSSWGVCENDVTGAYAQAENVVFEQMALQGQSMFNSAGDTGAYGCIRSDGTTIVDTNDPADQPWVTSVGGTSFSFDNPGTNNSPTYPNNGDESVWNVDNLCSGTASYDGVPGVDWCALTGAGGGGTSQWWGRPAYQFGAGVNNAYTTTGNGTTNCALAKLGVPCRETPDVSANADEYTGYAEYCTGTASTPYSTCGTFSGAQPTPGWFQIGGTSLSTPLWAALISDRDGNFGFRMGNLNVWAYALNAVDGHAFFHDITGAGQSMNNNGLYPTTPGFDDATGLGSPNFSAFITRLL